MTDQSNMLHFNGIDGASGNYLMPPMASEQLSEFITGSATPKNLAELKARANQGKARHYGVVESVDPLDLAQAGWGIIVPAESDEQVLEALAPLIRWRKEQAGDRFRIFKGEDAPFLGETKAKFLARHGMGPGPADPQKMPYYLMLVASPEEISYQFQFQLDVQYAVGRLYLEQPESYAYYAQTVVAVESGKLSVPRRINFMGVMNPDDRATRLSADHLVKPLAQRLDTDYSDWQVNNYSGETAGKSRLTDMFRGNERPGILFTASHGMSFPKGDPRQEPHQGAILCGDWPGPKNWRDPIPQDFYYAGDDVSQDAGPRGLMAFCHACFGAGVPLYDDFSRQSFRAREPLAERPFVTSLPQRLLGHPKGGALAVIGHVDRSWCYSFDWPGSGSQTAVFESTISAVMNGKPVGLAMDYFNERYAELATELTSELEEMEFGKNPNYRELAATWTAHNDARDYVVLGDPAVRLVHSGEEAGPVEPLVLRRPEPKPASKPPAESPATAAVPEPAAKRVSTQQAPKPEPSKPKPEEPKKPIVSGPESKPSREPRADLDIDAKALAKGLTQRLSLALKTLDHIEVRSHRGSLDGEAATLFAATKIELDGTLSQMVPSTEDDLMWRRHQESVRLALENRTAMLEAIGRILLR